VHRLRTAGALSRIARTGALLAAGLLVGLLVVVLVEAWLARRGGVEPFVGPSRAPTTLGSAGPALTYVVLGDSTGAGQGAPPDAGIAVATARHLARSHRVVLTNLAVSGAQMDDVAAGQLDDAVALAPDVVLIAAGANDVTALTSTSSVRDSLETIVDRLRAAAAKVRIVVTAAPDMGAAPRLAQPLRSIAGKRTTQVNDAIGEVVARRRLTLAPIAEQTGPLFRADPTLFAADRFHPSARGYATWVPVLNRALDRALGLEAENQAP